MIDFRTQYDLRNYIIKDFNFVRKNRFHMMSLNQAVDLEIFMAYRFKNQLTFLSMFENRSLKAKLTVLEGLVQPKNSLNVLSSCLSGIAVVSRFAKISSRSDGIKINRH
ncbi:hypothetical protein BpHYR1_047034 [Brachionus plicatilis]|uniref:Uncharacterized protein n=1 Tax=Brachionus plicatilis TaxID=10195 RepID=A0A3M7SPX9_BRAPC|nr:hypothetical protein BpHYR1_047034 [Brachionus plicatilis]